MDASTPKPPLWQRLLAPFKAAFKAVHDRIGALAENLVLTQQAVTGRLRAEPILVLFAITFAIVSILQPVKIGLTLWGVSKLALFAWLGDWIDRARFPEAQPSQLDGIAQGTAWKRKAAIMCVSMACGALMP
jgi:hypothetical protein